MPVMVLPDYRVEREDNRSVGRSRRYSLHVVVEPGATADDLLAVAREIAAHKRADGYDALNIGFSDYPELLGKTPWPLGVWEEAPGGQWGNAGPGGAHEPLQENTSGLKNKDWSQRPSQSDVDLWAKWEATGKNLLGALHPTDVATDPDQLAAELAELETDMTAAEVKAVIDRVALWPFQEA